MTAVQFYHLTATPLERILPKLLEKALAGGFKVLLVAGSDERVEHLNTSLWTYGNNSFLPHGSLKDGNIEDQPILIVSSLPLADGEIQRKFNLLAVTDGSIPPQMDAFGRILDIFDGNDPQAVGKARSRWTIYKNSGSAAAYLRQNETGGWEQKAVA